MDIDPSLAGSAAGQNRPVFASRGVAQRFAGLAWGPPRGPGPLCGQNAGPGGSAVGVPRASSAYGPAAPSPRRRLRTEDLDPAYGAVTEVLVEPAYDVGREQPHLGRPARRVGADGQLVVGVALGDAVLGDLDADNLVPPGEDGMDREVGLPAVLGDQPVDRCVQGLRIALVGMGPGCLAAFGLRLAATLRPMGLAHAVLAVAAGDRAGQVEPAWIVLRLLFRTRCRLGRLRRRGLVRVRHGSRLLPSRRSAPPPTAPARPAAPAP